MRRSLILFCVLAGIVGAAVPFAAPTAADVLQQLARYGRQNFEAVTTGAVVAVDQHGAGSILTLQDSNTSEYTFDLSSATFTNQLNLSDDLAVGNGTPGVTLNGEDAYVEGTLEVDGTSNFAGDVTHPSLSDGGNAEAVNEIIGVPKLLGFAVGTMTNGTASSKTVTGYIDETPAGEWVGTTNVTDATESTTYRKGTASLSLLFAAAAVAGNGADNTLAGGDEDWTADESYGFWHRCSQVTTAGDLVLEITDSVAGATTVNIPALATADKWTWVEVDISGVADASKDVVQTIAFDASTAGAALGLLTCYFDYAYKWDSTEEEALGQNILTDGVIAVYGTATASGSPNTPTLLAETTDYFIHYESGNDFIVVISDQSAASGWGLAAAQ